MPIRKLTSRKHHANPAPEETWGTIKLAANLLGDAVCAIPAGKSLTLEGNPNTGTINSANGLGIFGRYTKGEADLADEYAWLYRSDLDGFDESLVHWLAIDLTIGWKFQTRGLDANLHRFDIINIATPAVVGENDRYNFKDTKGHVIDVGTRAADGILRGWNWTVFDNFGSRTILAIPHDNGQEVGDLVRIVAKWSSDTGLTLWVKEADRPIKTKNDSTALSKVPVLCPDDTTIGIGCLVDDDYFPPPASPYYDAWQDDSWHRHFLVGQGDINFNAVRHYLNNPADFFATVTA